MLNKDELVMLMEKRGFDLHIHSSDGKRFQFLTKYPNLLQPARIRVSTISIKVDLVTKEFECVYMVPYSLNMLSTPKCGPITDDKHFDCIVAKFESHAAILERFIGGGN